MTRQDFSNERTRMEADGETLLIERVFAAPRDLVWTAMTSAQHIENWLGPRGTTTEVTEWNLHVGGTWRWVNKYEGGEVAFRGTFLEIEPPARIVRTEVMDTGSRDEMPAATETITFEVVEGGTLVRWITQFPSEQILGFAIEQGMAFGALSQMDRLADLLDVLAVK
jgi:uncharacterized protein YndB with AHSA1/START domain